MQAEKDRHLWDLFLEYKKRRQDRPHYADTVDEAVLISWKTAEDNDKKATELLEQYTKTMETLSDDDDLEEMKKTVAMARVQKMHARSVLMNLKSEVSSEVTIRFGISCCSMKYR
jgi:transcriptional accessory protein Tex/SPT6